MARPKKTTLLDAAMMGNTTPTMGELGAAEAAPKKKTKKKDKVSMLQAAIIGATTPSMGKPEAGKSAAEKTAKPKKR